MIPLYGGFRNFTKEHGPFNIIYELRDFLNGDRVYGTRNNIARYTARYHNYDYRDHSIYRKLQITRAFDGPQAKAMYRAVDPFRKNIIVGGSLEEVKA